MADKDLTQINKPASKVGRPSASTPPQVSSEKKRYSLRASQTQPDVRYETADTFHFTVTNGGVATSAKTVCHNGNVKHALFSVFKHKPAMIHSILQSIKWI